MPGKIKVKILAGRNLPVMDRSGDTTDAFVEIKFGTTTYKTEVCRKSLNPQWNSEWYKFEVEDAELQDEPLQIRLMDYDTYSANDAIGKVYVNLNPLLLPGVPPPVKNIWTLEASMNSSMGSQGGSVMTGWLPVYDTMHGIRGEVNIIVKVELFLDFNKFRQSSCGVTFFYSPIVPHGYHAQVIHGFVEELVVSDDPEYKWIDKIRTPRASNEARQTLFLKLSNEVQRKIGLKALDLGGNAVIGYLQNFDLEGESGIVARGIGTVVTLVKLHDIQNLLSEAPTAEEFGSQIFKSNKLQSPDCSESEDSQRSLPHQNYHHHHHYHHTMGNNNSGSSSNVNHNNSPISSPTLISSKFPLYGDNVPLQPVTPLKVIESKRRLGRQVSVNSLSSVNLKRGLHVGSSLSLADDVIDEGSMKAMLALEDMRGEPQGNRFSRGLKSLRYLPQSVLSKRSSSFMRPRWADSLDEESDFESTYSSTWSVCGSDSTKSSSIMDLHQSMRKKKFRHRKATGEGIAAMLIRSVHAGGPLLDSVMEDRETPVPSPVNFIDEGSADQSESGSPPKSEKNSDDQNVLTEIEKPRKESVDTDENVLRVSYSKPKLTNENEPIPAITSSESDTSSSDEDVVDDDDDDDEEPSESSTNYNILEDMLSLLDPSSSDIENCPTSGESQIQLYPTSQTNLTFQLMMNGDEIEKLNLITEKEEETSVSLIEIIDKKEKNFLSVDDILSSEFSSDIDSDLPLSAIPSDYRSKRTKKLSNSLKTIKPVEQDAQKNFSEPLNLMIPSEERESLLPIEMNQMKHVSPEHSPKSNNRVIRHRLHKQLSINQTDEDYQTESSDEEYYTKKHQRSSKIQEKKLLINFNDDQHQSSSEDYPGKISKRVERNETVIYKGLKEKKEENILDFSNNESPAIPPPLSPTVINPAPVVNCAAATDANHLQLPSVSLKDIVSKSLYPAETTLSENAQIWEMLNKKYRQSCMLDLIKVIDSKMLAHHHSHTESTRRRKHFGIDRRSPSPDSFHRKIYHYRRARSRSPDISSLGYHHHTPYFSHFPSSSMHNIAKHSQKNHHTSYECLSDRQYHAIATSNSESVMQHIAETVEEVAIIAAAKTLAHTKLNNNEAFDETELLEMHALKVHESLTNSNSVVKGEKMASIISSSTISNITPTTSTTFTNVSESKPTNIANATDNLCVSHSPSIRRQHHQQNQNQEIQQTSISPGGTQQQLKAHSPASKNPGIPLHRRSSDSDLSITPKDNNFMKKGRSFRLRSDRGFPSKSMLIDKISGNSLTGSDRSMGGYLKQSSAIVRTMNQEALEMLEYPFITMQQYPPGFVLHIGGLVSARSVKLLERITNIEEPEGRDSWWTEIRMEVRSHARALACNVVIGYKEETSICDDVCVLSGSGTAAVINLHSTGQDQDNVLITHVQGLMTASTESDKGTPAPPEKLQNSKSSSKDITEVLPQQQQQQYQPQQQTPATPATVTANHQTPRSKQRLSSESNEHETPYVPPSSGCSLCHLPYNKSSMSFQVSVSKCAVCRRAKVPDVLFTTVELPENLPMTGRGCLIQATVCKAKKDLRGELNAKEISDCLPFLEYELHSLLLNKLRMRGMNAAFGLKIQVSIGERLVIGMAAGTAVYLVALPPPSLPQIATGTSWQNEDQIAEIQKSLVDTVKKNMEFYQLKPLPEVENGRSMSDTDESEDEMPELDLGLGMKDVCVLEVDDVEDMDRISLLMDERPPNDFHVVNTETIPGLEDLEIVRNLQMFTQVSRAKIPTGQSASMPSKYFARVLQTVYFKLRRMVPCALCDLQFKIAMPEQDEIQLSVIGMALGLGEPTKYNKVRRRILSHSISKDQVKRADDNDMIFCLDEDHAENSSACDSAANPPNTPSIQSSTLSANSSQKSRPRSPLRMKHTMHRHKHVPLKERYGVDITPLSYLPGGRIERYLGNLNFFFIRESNSIRENGGLSGFIHSFVTEVLSIVRAHITAIGGNAMVAFFMTQCVLLHSPHKNQGQCLINVGGDVVSVSYFGSDKQLQVSALGNNC